jgi:hypothetical protein
MTESGESMDPILTPMVGVARVLEPAATDALKTGSKLLERLLGPSVDIMGAQWADRLREKNMATLLRKTQIRENADNPGVTAPRLAAQVFEAAQFADDEIVAEYFSGVLQSSRSDADPSDAGISWSALIGRLSSDQLRMHFLIYSSVRGALIELGKERANQLHETAVLVPLQPLFEQLDLSGARRGPRFSDALDGLLREGIIGGNYAYGPLDRVMDEDPQSPMRIVAPYPTALRINVTIHGIRLFLWGTGFGEGVIEQYLDSNIDLTTAEDEPALKLLEGAGVYDNFLQSA